MTTTESTTPPEEPKRRYGLNVDLWMNNDSVIAHSLDDLMGYIRDEIEGADGEKVVFTVTPTDMTDSELDALPEWDGP